jgi:rhomboid family GlyGly-CTERM serine protease
VWAAHAPSVEIQKAKLIVRAPLPWLTLSMAAAAIGERITPGAQKVFLYNRSLILDGQWWRLWSAHLAHYSFSHLFWNLVVFVPTGMWLEKQHPRSTRLFLLFTPAIVSAAIFWLEPALQIYAGISGIAVGTLTLLALFELLEPPRAQKWLWGLILILIFAKIAAEFGLPGTAIFVSFPKDFHNVPLSHLGGAVCAAIVFAFSALSRERNEAAGVRT